MSAICGVFARRGPADLNLKNVMVQVLKRRKAHPVRESSGTEFAFAGSQLLSDSQSGLSIVSDARLDNRVALVNRLRASSEASDALLLLKAYEHWGERCTKHLLGDFAFAIHDAGRNSLFCARDHMGVKPFYYFLADDLLLFATEVLPLKAALRDRLTINRFRVADYLLGLEYDSATSTFYNEVSRLPSAHHLTVTASRQDVQRYWSPDCQEQLGRSDLEVQDQLQSVLVEALASRLDEVESAGLLLSGGVDSAVLAALADEQGYGLKLYSGISPGSTGGDAEAISQVARTVSMTSVVEKAVTTQVPSGLTEKLQLLDDPFAGQLTLVAWLYQLAAEAGTTVMLDGVDGDLVFSLARNYPASLLRSGQWAAARHEYHSLINQQQLVDESFGRYALRTLAPQRISARWQTRSLQEDIRSSIPETLLAAHLKNDPKLVDHFLQLHLPTPSFLSPSEQYRWWLLQPYIQIAMERYDRVAGLFGIEPRHPLLDKRVVEFCAELPWDQKCRDGWNKWALRCFTSHYLPEEVAWRTDKPHFGSDFQGTLLRSHWQEVREVIADSQALWEPYADPGYVLPSLQEPPGADTDLTVPLRLYHLTWWLQASEGL